MTDSSQVRRLTSSPGMEVRPSLPVGATGYLLKDTPREEFFRAVRAAYRGEAVLASSVATRLMSQLGAPAQEAFSERQLDVPALVALGLSNRQVAAWLFISKATLKTHLGHIYTKLDGADRAAAFECSLLPSRRT